MADELKQRVEDFITYLTQKGYSMEDRAVRLYRDIVTVSL